MAKKFKHVLQYILVLSSCSSGHQTPARVPDRIRRDHHDQPSFGLSKFVCTARVVELNRKDCLLVELLSFVVSVKAPCHHADLASQSACAIRQLILREVFFCRLVRFRKLFVVVFSCCSKIKALSNLLLLISGLTYSSRELLLLPTSNTQAPSSWTMEMLKLSMFFKISVIFWIAPASQMIRPLPSSLQTVIAPACSPVFAAMSGRVAHVTSNFTLISQPPDQNSTCFRVP